jgi:hypothetical protein
MADAVDGEAVRLGRKVRAEATAHWFHFVLTLIDPSPNIGPS